MERKNVAKQISKTFFGYLPKLISVLATAWLT